MTNAAFCYWASVNMLQRPTPGVINFTIAIEADFSATDRYNIKNITLSNFSSNPYEVTIRGYEYVS